MSCFRGLKAYKWKHKFTEKGKALITFSMPDLYKPETQVERIILPCGQCIGCKLERSRQWAMRCVNEASMYEENCFVTLTYNDFYLPSNESLQMRDFQLFMKRLRKRESDRKIRFFSCGEYGDKFQRPHYHACIFNFDFKDKILWRERRGVKLYLSESLNKLWSDRKYPIGYCVLGAVDFESAAYTARYCLKKITGKKAAAHYRGRSPEYTTMSRGGRGSNGENLGGIGKGFYEMAKKYMYAADLLMIKKGVECKPAKYYDKCYEIDEPEDMKLIKEKRKEAALCTDTYVRSRMRSKEIIVGQQTKLLTRGFEDGTESTSSV